MGGLSRSKPCWMRHVSVFPACNNLSQQIGSGTLSETSLTQTLRTFAYAIETIAAFQMNQYDELLHIARKV